MPPEILTTEQLAERLKTNPETIRRLARAGSLPSLRVGSEYRYDWAAVHSAIEQPAHFPDHLFVQLVNDLRDCAVTYAGTQQLRERLAAILRKALPRGEGRA